MAQVCSNRRVRVEPGVKTHAAGAVAERGFPVASHVHRHPQPQRPRPGETAATSGVPGDQRTQEGGDQRLGLLRPGVAVVMGWGPRRPGQREPLAPRAGSAAAGGERARRAARGEPPAPARRRGTAQERGPGRLPSGDRPFTAHRHRQLMGDPEQGRSAVARGVVKAGHQGLTGAPVIGADDLSDRRSAREIEPLIQEAPRIAARGARGPDDVRPAGARPDPPLARDAAAGHRVAVEGAVGTCLQRREGQARRQVADQGEVEGAPGVFRRQTDPIGQRQEGDLGAIRRLCAVHVGRTLRRGNQLRPSAGVGWTWRRSSSQVSSGCRWCTR